MTSEEGTLFDIDRRSLVRLSLNDDGDERHSELELLIDLRETS